MTGRDIALEALTGRPTPRPAAGFVAGGEWFVHQAGQEFENIINDPEQLAGTVTGAHRLLRPDLMWPGAGLLNHSAHLLGAPLKYSGSTTPALSGPAVDSTAAVADLDPDTALRHPTMDNIIRAQHLMADSTGRECLLLPTQWGPLTTAARLAGLDRLMMDFIRDPDAVDRALEWCAGLIWQIAQRVMDHDLIPGFNISEPVASGNVISPKLFDRFVLPELAGLTEKARAAGKLTMIHICGDTTGLLPRVADIGPDGFSLETAVDLAEARRVLGGRVGVVGNVSPTGNLASGTPDQVRAEARACLDAWGDGPGLIVANGCDIPKTTPPENLAALLSVRGPLDGGSE